MWLYDIIILDIYSMQALKTFCSDLEESTQSKVTNWKDHLSVIHLQRSFLQRASYQKMRGELQLKEKVVFLVDVIKNFKRIVLVFFCLLPSFVSVDVKPSKPKYSGHKLVRKCAITMAIVVCCYYESLNSRQKTLLISSFS